LTALEFDPESGHEHMLTRERAHANGYPDLVSTLKEYWADLRKGSNGMQQLQRIEFLEQESPAR
jgi:hypothetical protein